LSKAAKRSVLLAAFVNRFLDLRRTNEFVLLSACVAVSKPPA